MSLACEAPDFDESIVGGSDQVETGRREANMSHVPAKVKKNNKQNNLCCRQHSQVYILTLISDDMYRYWFFFQNSHFK